MALRTLDDFSRLVERTIDLEAGSLDPAAEFANEGLDSLELAEVADLVDELAGESDVSDRLLECRTIADIWALLCSLDRRGEAAD